MEDTRIKIVSIISDVLGAEKDKITDDKTLEDLGADSLDKVELVIAIEEEFSIDIVDEAAELIVTVGDTIKAVESCLKEKAAA